MNKKTRNAVITLIMIIALIILLSTGVYINKQVLSFILGGIGLLILEIGLYFLKGWDKEQNTIEELKLNINKALLLLEQEKIDKEEIKRVLKGE